jgi:hypothetical protein
MMNLDEAITDTIIKMIKEEGGMKRSELRTEYFCNFPQYNKDFDRLVDELILTKNLIEVEYILEDLSPRAFILPSKTQVNIRGINNE